LLRIGVHRGPGRAAIAAVGFEYQVPLLPVAAACRRARRLRPTSARSLTP